MPKTLAHRAASLDSERFQGRAQELAVLERIVSREGTVQVVLLHGPGGIGKSALLRELARRAERQGLTPRVLDGRDVMPVPGAIERALDGVHDDDRPLVILDSYERVSGADGWLRGSLIPSLPEAARVIIASRRPPHGDWFRDGWEHLAAELELTALDTRDAHALLGAYGMPSGAQADDLVRWARGWPLALSLAAGAFARDGALAVTEPGSQPDVLRSAVAHVARSELEVGHLDEVAVAALARTCDARLLADVLPGVDADAMLSRLRELSFAESVGGGVSLHDLVRHAIRAELEARHAERAHDLRRRIADHFHNRAVGGERHTLIDLTELIDDRALRWGLGAEGSVRYRVDSVRPGDLEALEPWYTGRDDWWRDVAALVTEAPERVVLARDTSDRLVGVSIAVTLSAPPPVAGHDAVLGPWLAHARAHWGTADVLLWRDATDFQRNGDPASPVVSLMNTAAILDSGLSNIRCSYIPLDPGNDAAVRFSHSVGGRAIPELAVKLDGRMLECHMIDHGPGGMIGQLREVVYAELRLPTEAGRPGPKATAEAVRDALRHLHRPSALAANPLARGSTPEERAASVRALISGAAIQAFGESPEELLLRRVLERGYIDPDGKHEQVAEQLNLSRTAYFRRLRTASERLASWLLEQKG